MEGQIQNRGRGRAVLNIVLTSIKNVMIVEQLIYEKSSGGRGDYNSLIYQAAGLCKLYDLKDVVRMIVEDRFYFNKQIYNKHHEKRLQFIEYMNRRPEIVEGVSECPRCKSKRVLSMQKQTRRADEGSTTFNVCQECEFKWTSNN
jgi:DNA-directed RNA polymerase subunit M/transcription elongation factor TFIIS